MSTHGGGGSSRRAASVAERGRSYSGGGGKGAGAASAEERANRAETTAAKRLDAYRKAHDAAVASNYAEVPIAKAETAYKSWETARSKADAARNRAEIAKGGYDAEVRQSLPDRFHAVGETQVHGTRIQYLEDKNTHEVYRRVAGSRDIRWESRNPWNSEQKLHLLTHEDGLRPPQALRRTQALVRENEQRTARERTAQAEELARTAASRARAAEAYNRTLAEARARRQAEEQRQTERKAAARQRAAATREAKRAASFPAPPASLAEREARMAEVTARPDVQRYTHQIDTAYQRMRRTGNANLMLRLAELDARRGAIIQRYVYGSPRGERDALAAARDYASKYRAATSKKSA